MVEFHPKPATEKTADLGATVMSQILNIFSWGLRQAL